MDTFHMKYWKDESGLARQKVLTLCSRTISVFVSKSHRFPPVVNGEMIGTVWGNECCQYKTYYESESSCSERVCVTCWTHAVSLSPLAIRI